VLGAGDGDVGEAGFGGLDLPGQRVAVEGGVLGVFGFGEVVGDADGGPFAAFGGVGVETTTSAWVSAVSRDRVARTTSTPWSSMTSTNGSRSRPSGSHSA
jgi:hypothetical protein